MNCLPLLLHTLWVQQWRFEKLCHTVDSSIEFGVTDIEIKVRLEIAGKSIIVAIIE
jgi:hypothetical protein